MNSAEEKLEGQILFREMREKTVRIIRTMRTVWCLSCAETQLWSPVQDGSSHSCGYPLSPYGPFEETPTWCPTPDPLPARWSAGSKPPEVYAEA